MDAAGPAPGERAEGRVDAAGPAPGERAEGRVDAAGPAPGERAEGTIEEPAADDPAVEDPAVDEPTDPDGPFVTILVEGSLEDKSPDDGLSAQTPAVYGYGLQRLELLRSLDDEDPYVVFDYAPDFVIVDLYESTEVAKIAIPSSSSSRENSRRMSSAVSSSCSDTVADRRIDEEIAAPERDRGAHEQVLPDPLQRCPEPGLCQRSDASRPGRRVEPELLRRRSSTRCQRGPGRCWPERRAP